MPWWLILGIGVVLGLMIVDWFIVMGANVHKWKGGKKK